MAHFAKVVNGIVEQVIVSEKDFINSGTVGDEFLWIQTSYNSSFRKNFAQVGGTYNRELDAFISIKPYASWTLNETTYQWESPVSYPDDETNMYTWNESETNWEITDTYQDR